MTEIELDYQLSELPSPQHRAGLAALVLMVKELHRYPEFRQRDGVLLELKELEPYQVKLQLNLEGLKALFDFTYQSFEARRWTETKPKEYKEMREVEIIDKKTGKPKTIKQYGYDVVVPHGAFLPDFDQSSDDPQQKIWVKLWRDMLWNIIRGVPTTRNPFNLRVNNQSYSKDTEQIWKDLQNPKKLTGQTGQYFLGAMASNPENIPIKEQVRYQFLLHFWPFVAQVYCPALLDKDGKREIAGYVLAIPDVADLKKFSRVFFKVLEARNTELWRYLPREAVIDLPQEGALDLLRLLRDRISKEIGDQDIRRTILGVEIIHAEKVGKSGVKIRSISYVEPILTQIDRYQAIIKNYWCPWFRKQRLLNLINSLPASDEALAELPAWIEFDALLSRIPRKWLEDPYFSHDARQLFEQEVNVQMKTEIRDYAQIVYKVCQGYVLGKLKSKDDLEWEKCKGNPQLEKKYNDKKYKIVNEAFLAVRSRTESQAFIDYFVSTLYPFVREKEFTDFAEALFNKTDEIRSLTLLALSSQYPLKRSEEEQKPG